MGSFQIVWAFSLTLLFGLHCAAATWPSSYDELEDIMLLNQGYRARQLSLPVTPCHLERAPGRIPAAGFVRTAFHDVAHHDVATGQGGMDASIAWELTGTPGKDNAGPAFNNTLTFVSRYYSTQASMSDLLALALYTAVRGCGGPSIPIRTGRKDATGAGALGVPHVNDTQEGFKDTFRRMGFNTEDMIKMVACGHTLGGVHSQQFPDIVPAGSRPEEVGTFDNTSATFDNQVAVQFVQNTTQNPLVVGPDTTNSDKKVFQADSGVTIRQLTDAQNFRNSCRDILQRMVDVVPAGVQLTEPIQVYEVKPGALQLSLTSNGSSLLFSGEVRVRTTLRPQSSIASVKVVLASRSDYQSNPISATAIGTASGYDESFTFYSFLTSVDVDAHVRSFHVIVTDTDGVSVTYDNNGQSFPVESSILLQLPDCSLTESPDASGKRTVEVVAAIRGDESIPSMTVALQTARDIPIPLLTKSDVALSKQKTAGDYTLYKGTFQITTSQINSTSFDLSAVINGKTRVLVFNKLVDFGLPSNNDSTSSTITTQMSTSTLSTGSNQTLTDAPYPISVSPTHTKSPPLTTSHDRGSPWIDWSPKPDQPGPTRFCGTAAGCDADPWASETIWAVPTPKDLFAHTRPAGTYLGPLIGSSNNDGGILVTSKSSTPIRQPWSMENDVKTTGGSDSALRNSYDVVTGTKVPVRPTASSNVQGLVKVFTGDAVVQTAATWLSGVSAFVSIATTLCL